MCYVVHIVVVYCKCMFFLSAFHQVRCISVLIVKVDIE